MTAGGGSGGAGRGGKAGEPIPVRLRLKGNEELITKYAEHPELRGIFIPTSVKVPVGARIDLTLDLGGGRGLRTMAEVVWHREATSDAAAGGVGVRFLSLPPAQQRWLDDQVEERVRAQQAPAAPANGHQLRKAQAATQLDDSTLSLEEADFSEAAGTVMGIDLGTCNSCACVVEDGEPLIINLRDDDEPETQKVRSVPSVVSYDDDGRVSLGKKALAGLTKNPRRTIFGAKRFIGRAYDSPAVQTMLGRFPYKIVPGPGNRAAIEINNRPVALTAISAKLLADIRLRVERELKRSVDRAIITVPAYYNDNQREAVVQAGRLAGLHVERILNEPTAAAIAYGLLGAKPRRLMVYDLGGGTFDVSVMTVHRDSLQVLSTAGDTFLGGEDFDEVVVRHVYSSFTAQRKNTPPLLSQNSAAAAAIKLAAEQAKRRLSLKQSTMVMVRDALLTDGATTRLEVEITRPQYEQGIEPLVARTLKICDMALREARLSPADLGDLLLVGGQSRCPYVQKRVREHFKITPRCDLDPDEVVAMGAAMLANLSRQDAEKLQDVLSMSIGVAAGARFKPVIQRNTPLPCAKQVKITVPRARWNSYQLDVWQGDSADLFRNECLGGLKVDALEPGDADPVPVRIDFALTPDCLLKVRLVNLATTETKSVLLNTRDAG